MGVLQVEADGVQNEMLSNEMNVVPGQPIALSIWVKWTGVSYTGVDPISFGLTEYALNRAGQMEEGLSVDIDSFTSPATDSDNPDPEHDDFLQLAGNYTVPEDGSVQQIRMRLKIGSNLTAGTVWFGDGEMVPGAEVRDEVVPGIGRNIDTISNKLYGQDITGWTQLDAGNALGAQNSTVKGSAITLAGLLARLTPGVSASDLFNVGTVSTPPEGALGANWEENYGSGNGYWVTDGSGFAYFAPDYPYGPRESLIRWIGTNMSSNTDYQTVSVVISRILSKDFNGYPAYSDVIARCDATHQNYIRLRVTSSLPQTGIPGTWSLSKFISGTETVLASGDIPSGALSAGSVLTLVAGDKLFTVPRHFTCIIGSSVVAQGAFSDTTSNYGASYRGWGFGGKINGPLFSSTDIVAPGAVDYWAGSDTA